MSYVYGPGLNWSSDIDEDTKKAFEAARGTHSPYGSPIPNELAVGKRWEDDKYVYQVTPGDDKQPGWGAYAPSSNAQKMGSTVGNDGTVFNPNGNFTDSDRKADPMLVWRTPKSPASSSPAASAEPKEQKDRYAEARQLAEQFTRQGGMGSSYASGVQGSPAINVSGSPQDLYDSINQKGNSYLADAEASRKRFYNMARLGSAEMTAAMGAAVDNLPDNLKLTQAMTPDDILAYAKKAAGMFGLA